MGKINKDQLIKLKTEGKSNKECASFFQCSEPAISKMWKDLAKIVKVNEMLSAHTPQQRQFILAKTDGLSTAEAGGKAYPDATPESQKTLGKRLMKDSAVVQTIQTILENEGATPTWVAKNFKRWGDSQDSMASLRAVENTAKLHDLYPAQKTQSLNLNVTVGATDYSKYRNPPSRGSLYAPGVESELKREVAAEIVNSEESTQEE